MLGQSTPSFVVGLVIIYVLSVYFGVVPTMGTFTPALCRPAGQSRPADLSGRHTGLCLRRFRHPHRPLLHARGAERRLHSHRPQQGRLGPQRRLHHALPNALIPVVTLSGVEFGYLLGGAVIVEQVFALPGVGRLVLDAINQRDYALVGAPCCSSPSISWW